MALDAACSPEQTWQAVVKHLQGVMACGDFNAYIKETCLIDYSESCFLVGCPDATSRDWLEARLSSTIERALIGLLGQKANVKFVLLGHPVTEQEVQDDAMDIELRQRSIRNSLLEPQRVVAFPVYFLRWLPYVGAQTIFLVMAMWQEYYLASSGRRPTDGCKVSVRAERVCRWAGISRSQFFRMIQSNKDLNWFLRKIDTDHEIDRRSGRTKKSSNRYELFEIPLTPGDAEDLRTHLLAEGIQSSPEEVLRAAAGRHPREILRYPARLVEGFQDQTPNPQTVQDIIREILGYRLEGTLAELADQLAARILAEGDFLLVSWYFLMNWLPLLGADAAMFVLMLRHHCYFNSQTGEMRDEVWMEGGYAAIASRLGVRNPREVANWLPAIIERGKKKEQVSDRTHDELARRQRLRDLVGLFVSRIDHHRGSSGVYSWKFKVQRSDPLTPRDQILVLAASRLLRAAQKVSVMAEFSAWIERRREFPGEERVVLKPSEWSKGCSETLARLLDDWRATLGQDANDCFETLLKILKSSKDSEIHENTSLPPEQTGQCEDQLDRLEAGVTDAKGNWSLKSLLSRIDRENRTVLLSREKDARAFLSWLLYGASQRAIRDPLSLVVARLRKEPGADAGGASSRLASRPPRDLASLIRQALAGYSPDDQDWQMLFGEIKTSRIQLLADILKLHI